MNVAITDFIFVLGELSWGVILSLLALWWAVIKQYIKYTSFASMWKTKMTKKTKKNIGSKGNKQQDIVVWWITASPIILIKQSLWPVYTAILYTSI